MEVNTCGILSEAGAPLTGEFELTLKAMKHVSEMRSNLRLLDRSDVPRILVQKAREDVTSYLARRILIYPQSMVALGLEPGMTYHERRERLKIPDVGIDMSPEEREFERWLQSSGRKQRKDAWIWRIGTEAEDMSEKGWYPFFVTLTVDPSRCADSKEMWKEGREFDKYLTRIARVSAKACGHPRAIQDGVSRHLFVRHVGVIEHGKSNHHHHMHLLLWMRGIPEEWKVCPNKGIADPSSRTIDFCRQLGTFWHWSLPGIGVARYFRHMGDVWSKLGFATPVRRDTRKAINILPPRAAGVYVAKYMDKEDKAWTHRVKATRDLGKGRLRNLLHSLDLKTLESLTWRPRRFPTAISMQTMQSVPSGLMRSMAKQVLFCKNWEAGNLDCQTLLQPSCDVFEMMRKSVRDGARPKRMSSQALYDWVTGHLPEPIGYCEKRLEAAYRVVSYEFPVCNAQKVEKIGGMLQ
jgi:hypothetical protein